MIVRQLPVGVALLAALAVVPHGPAAAQTGDKVDGSAIAETLVGNTFDGTLPDGSPMRMFAEEGGGLHAVFRDAPRRGEWRVAGDTFCGRWLDLAPEAWGCFNLLATGDGYAFQRMNGTIQSHGILLPGDAFGLAGN